MLSLVLHLQDIDPPTSRGLSNFIASMKTFLLPLPDTLEQAEPIPCIARAMNKSPKLLLNAKAKPQPFKYFSHRNLPTQR